MGDNNNKAGGTEGRRADDLLVNPKRCAKCCEPGCCFKCPCKQVSYCDEDCQKADWPLHKEVCVLVRDKKVKELKKQHGKDAFMVAEARMHAGDAHGNEGRYTEAEKCYLEARRIYAGAAEGGKMHPRVANACQQLGQVYDFMERYDESITELEEALRISKFNEGAKGENVARSLHYMSRPLRKQGRYDEALAKAKEAHSIFTEKFGSRHEEVLNCDTEIGLVSGKMGMHNEAEKALKRAMLACRMEHGCGSDKLATKLLDMGVYYSGQGKYTVAMKFYEEALEIGRRFHGDKHVVVADALRNIANILAR